MTPRRIFLSPEDLCEEEVTFPQKTAHYLRNVLRLKSGDCVEVLAGERQCTIRLIVPRSGDIRGEIVDSKATELCVSEELTLAFSCVRPGPFEEILRHGTELGVSRFVPVLTHRANRRPREFKQRWGNIVAAAAAQSQRTRLPEVRPPVSFDNFIENLSDCETKLLLSTSPEAEPILAFLDSYSPCEVTILVGPEGGLYDTEVSKAITAGFNPVSLGTGMLRAETAALVAAAAVAMVRQRSSIRGWTNPRRR